MKCHRLNNQHGSVLLFTTVTLVLLLVFGGIAIDLTYFGSVRRELQRSMDAAALAGAGNLGFDDTAFPAARAAAQNYANLNGYSDPAAGVVSLNPNTANDPDGEIVLGIWDGANFAPSLDGTQVNAVRCSKFETPIPIPTSFLRLLGMANLPMRAQAIAVANPPLLPPNSCVGPFALSDCFFRTGEATSSLGCGTAGMFITSSGNPGSTNTAAWANLCGTSTPSAPQTQAVIDGLASGNCNVGCATPQPGTEIGTNNGMQQSTFDALESAFVQNFDPEVKYLVNNSSGGLAYEGPGWKLFVPVIDTGPTCPPGPISGAHQVTGWTELVITQIYDRNNGCAVTNTYDKNSAAICSTFDPSLRAVFGYYNCTLVKSVASREPGPRSALGTKLRLVK